jgi:hypothetical protein
MMCDAVEQRAAVDAEKNENRGRDAGKKYEASGRIQASYLTCYHWSKTTTILLATVSDLAYVLP